jgi:hypothetical protein
MSDYYGILLVNLADCEIRSVLFGLRGRVEEWNLTLNAKIQDHKIYSITVYHHTAAVKQFCHWPYRTFSHTSLTGSLNTLGPTRIFRQLPFKHGIIAVNVTLFT